LDAELSRPYLTRLEGAFDRIGRYITANAVAQQATVPGPLLSGSQRAVLRALLDGGPCPVSEVAAHLGVTLSAATGLVDRLVKAKLVVRDRDQKDRRVVWVKITPDGESAVKAAEERRHVAMSQLVSHMPEQDLAALCEILERMVQE